ncbi:hypothetical protein Glove_537g3 [Diversispora epigaea]|uniref:Uncharacterized protein n=1 Tax=Diversispora epigaea TaxID=1348612 RepID=A0A397GGF6_9GLOM|nr:hypothetical protein Glove_537g3 [Diversispora epigaea]
MAEVNNKIELIQELCKKIKTIVINSDSECPTISYEGAKTLGLEIDKRSSNTTDKVVSRIIKQVSGKKIQISLCQLLEIVKPEIGLEIIDLIANPNIARVQRCKVKKKSVLNYPSSSFSSESGSGLEFESDSNNEMATYITRAKKRD